MSRALPSVDGDPASGAQFVSELRRVHAESVLWWRDFSTPLFFAAPAPGVWSPADQVRHLTKSVRPVARALGLPRFVLRLLFGRARSPSRSYTTLRTDYLGRLAAGGQAGRFAPAPRAAVTGADAETARAMIMARHAGAIDSLCAMAARWPETALDTLRLPHPLLGLITVREMLAFTLYHNVHHVRVAERRRLAGSSGPATMTEA